MYQFLVRSEDEMVGTYLRFFTFRSREEIETLDAATRDHPERREAQRVLAHDLVALVHGEEEARRAEHASEVLFSEDIRDLDEATLLAVMEEAPSSAAAVGQPLVDVLIEAGLAKSRREARTFLGDGGVYVNNRKVPDAEATLSTADLLHGRYALLRRGKQSQHLLRISSGPRDG
jgi:tyrosyl-tRNA synthetase